ncbi:MAG: PDZ domain-containing protein [Alphaproteobacteria bacterium]|nr:PDZ domain-containing protein [Alphaproteobacteria bacterium]
MSRRAWAGLALVAALVLLVFWWTRGSGSEGQVAIGPDGRVRTVFDGAREVPDIPGTRGPEVVASGQGVLGLEAHGTDPETVVTCAVEPAIESVSAEVIDDALPDIPEVARIADGILVLPAPRKSGSGVLKVEGYVPVPFTWSDGRCVEEPLHLVVGGAAIVGKVFNADGEPEGAVRVWGCGSSVKTDSDGSYYLEGIPGRACTVQATRQDGVFTANSPEVPVTPRVNDDQVVDLHLPPFRTAGLGIVVRETEQGIVVDRVLSGGSASDGGLEPGDVVLAIDGEDAEMLSLEEFVELALGEPGSEVELEVEGPGGVRKVTLDRREM